MMNRRDFVRAAGVASAGAAMAGKETLFGAEPGPPRWRTFEVETRIEVLQPAGTTRVWAPAAMLRPTPFQRTIANDVHCEGGTAKTFQTDANAPGIAAAEFPAGVKPALTVVNRVRTKNWTVDLTARSGARAADAAELAESLRPTRYLPTDGIVKETADEITKGAGADVEKARAIYEWIVENTYRNPKTRGCGLGDIRFMLESRDLGGKCADLNSLYVGLARASGLPARDVYGIRTAKSELGYKSLGASSEKITKAQHCRAEVYLRGYGWTPVDPADVRKVMLEEPPGSRPIGDAMVKSARERLFGSWEMNWMAFNSANDVKLPGSDGPAIPFLMYPQAETGGRRIDSLDPDSFRYAITVKEIEA